jgi:hypothetical protein
MQRRRRSAPHTFEENIAAEKAKLEAQIAKLKPGPQRDGLLRKIRQLETRPPHERVAHLSGAPTTRTRLEVRPPQLAASFIPVRFPGF